MSEKKEKANSELPRGKITVLIDVPYPRRIWDKMRKGVEFDFQELVNTGMVMAYITAYDDELESIRNYVVDWANRNRTVHVIMDLDADQKYLNRFLEINKNNERIDYTGLGIIFEKICLYSSVLSEHQNEEHPSLVSMKTRIIKFHSGKYTAYYIAISSHPDLIDDQRLEQLMDQSRQRFEKNISKSESNGKLSKQDTIGQSSVYNITIDTMIDSQIQQGTVNSTQNQEES